MWRTKVLAKRKKELDGKEEKINQIKQTNKRGKGALCRGRDRKNMGSHQLPGY